MNEVKMNDRVKMGSEPTRAGANKTKEERIVQREKF